MTLYRAGTPTSRIDHLWHHGFPITLTDTQILPSAMSDHAMVLGEIKLVIP